MQVLQMCSEGVPLNLPILFKLNTKELKMIKNLLEEKSTKPMTSTDVIGYVVGNREVDIPKTKLELIPPLAAQATIIGKPAKARNNAAEVAIARYLKASKYSEVNGSGVWIPTLALRAR